MQDLRGAPAQLRPLGCRTQCQNGQGDARLRSLPGGASGEEQRIQRPDARLRVSARCRFSDWMRVSMISAGSLRPGSLTDGLKEQVRP